MLWGGFPIYWPLLEPGGALEILAHRMLWSLLSVGVVVLALRRWKRFTALFAHPRTFMLLLFAAIVITINWLTFIWAVNAGKVVEVSFGYFINPLVTVLMGVFVIGERLRPLQWGAVAFAAVAVIVLTIDYQRLPWAGLILALTFACYGLAKKSANAPALESLAVETALMAPLAGCYLVWLGVTGGATFAAHGLGHALLLTSTGVVTAVPLVLFGAAATRMSMVNLGLLQYLAPIIQFALGVLYFREEMTAGRWAGFVVVWLALVVFTVEAHAHHRRQLRLAAIASAA